MRIWMLCDLKKTLTDFRLMFLNIVVETSVTCSQTAVRREGSFIDIIFVNWNSLSLIICGRSQRSAARVCNWEKRRVWSHDQSISIKINITDPEKDEPEAAFKMRILLINCFAVFFTIEIILNTIPFAFVPARRRWFLILYFYSLFFFHGQEFWRSSCSAKICSAIDLRKVHFSFSVR